MTTAPNAAPKNIAATAATLLANLGLLPLASEESAPMPVIVVAQKDDQGRINVKVAGDASLFARGQLDI